MNADPSVAVERRKVKKSSGYEPWTVSDIDNFRDHWPITFPQRLAFELLHWTAARSSDAVRLGLGMVDRQGWLVFRQQKTGGEVAIPFKRALPDFAVGMQADLDVLIATISHAPRHMTWLVPKFGAA